MISTTSNTDVWYEMRTGAKSMMYTLWRCVFNPGDIQNGNKGFNHEQYIKNLSINREEALQKAQGYALENDRELFDAANNNLNKIYYSKPDTVNFGKYKGTKIVDLPDGYLQWFAEGGKIEKQISLEENLQYNLNIEVGETYTVYLVSEVEQRQIAVQECLKRGIFIERNGEIISKKLNDWIEKANTGFGHHYSDKEKVILDLTFLRETSFDSEYGTIWIQTFEDSEGRKFQYKGNAGVCVRDPERIRMHNSEDDNIDPNDVEKVIKTYGYYPTTSVKKGDRITVKATVKLGEYKENKVTYLQRIKVVY